MSSTCTSEVRVCFLNSDYSITQKIDVVLATDCQLEISSRGERVQDDPGHLWPPSTQVTLN